MSTSTTDRRQGLTSDKGMKAPVKVATTANITLSGLQTIDGVSVAADDYVLVKDQTDSTENGIWIANSSDWTRRSDANDSRDLACGTTVFVTSGSSNSRTYWRISSADPITPGTTALSWTTGLRYEDVINVLDYGAVGNGIANDTTAIDTASAAAISLGQRLIFPAGSYLYSGTVYVVDAEATVINRAYPSGPNETALASNNAISIVFATPDTTPGVTADTRQGITVTGMGRGGQNATCIKGTLQNYSTDTGGSAYYAKASSDTAAQFSFSYHGESRHGGGTTTVLNVEAASYSTAGSFYGIVLLNSTNGAEATHPLTGLGKAAHPSATAILVTGTNTTDPQGGWVEGIRFKDQSMRAAGICIDVEANAAITAVLQTATATACATADILLQGNSSNGIILNGSYTNAAIRIKTGQYLSLTTAGTHKILAGSGTPEAAVSAPVGSLFIRTDGGAGTSLYVKESGTGNTGWVGK